MLPYLRLFRISNIFTVIADTTAAFLLVHQGIDAPVPYLLLLAAGCLQYIAGMILNDVYDLEQDRQERPNRPLPHGDIPVPRARALGYGFLTMGIGLAFLAGWVGSESPELWWRSGGLGVALAVAIVLYDLGLKRTSLGPIAMGSCRSFNLLMAGSLVAAQTPWEFRPALLCFAGGIGIYIAGVTWFARTEARESNARVLMMATSVMMLGLGILGLASFVDDVWVQGLRGRSPWFWPGLIGLIGVTTLRRCLNGVTDPSPATVQLAVKQAIHTLIIIDAGVCMFAIPDQIYYSLFVLLLLVPTLWLGRWIRAT